ncbi:MAG: PAS domain-containing protein [Devosia sp.]
MNLLASNDLDAATSLMLALVDSSRTPLLLLDGDLHVVAASASFYSGFEANPLHTLGRLLSELGSGEWGRPQLGAVLKAAVSGLEDIQTYEMDLTRRHRETRTVVLTVHKLEYGVGEQVRLMVTIADVTEARAAELFKK